ncbi:MAG: hypothetical protein AB1918_17660, partial [Pseudomonadota bacterium]
LGGGRFASAPAAPDAVQLADGIPDLPGMAPVAEAGTEVAETPPAEAPAARAGFSEQLAGIAQARDEDLARLIRALAAMDSAA